MTINDHHHVAAVATITSNKWTLLILHVLVDGTKRYHEISGALPGITQKILTNRLRRLEQFGLITRNAYPTIPPRVEYDLTDTGRSLTKAYIPVISWARSNLQDANLWLVD